MELSILGQRPSSTAGCSSGSCGSSSDRMLQLPEDVRQKVQNHPCYSEDAHHYFARMHVAVAPACNIQCHYCNRKYNCANESRPGVVSELLTPTQAAMMVKAVAATIPQMSVLGIAGPGDPLANPQRTFETFRRVREEIPDLKLCLSTNGLNLPQHIDDIARYDIDHVTITINCLDAEIGRKIYPWIFWNHRRILGKKAAQILIAQQQKGLEMLVTRGILVKINSVLIPGVNDKHLEEVSQVVKAKGAFLHNIMPLIAKAEHGTFYGLTGQRSPSHEEVQDLQDRCGDRMNMMRHCRQCRADAVGLLGEDRGAQFTLEKLNTLNIDYTSALKMRAEVQAALHETLSEKQNRKKHLNNLHLPTPISSGIHNIYPPALIAVATKGNGLINQHFGHAHEFLVYEASPAGIRFIGHRNVESYCTGNDHCGEGENTLANNVRALKGCAAILCAKIGMEPWNELEAAHIQPNSEHAMEPIEESVLSVYREMIHSGRLHSVNPNRIIVRSS